VCMNSSSAINHVRGQSAPRPLTKNTSAPPSGSGTTTSLNQRRPYRSIQFQRRRTSREPGCRGPGRHQRRQPGPTQQFGRRVTCGTCQFGAVLGEVSTGEGKSVSMPRSVWRHGDPVTLPLRSRGRGITTRAQKTSTQSVHCLTQEAHCQNKELLSARRGERC
jgi:hypothetical protein